MRTKFKYDQGSIVFFIVYKGAVVELLRAKLKVMDLGEVRRLQRIAEQNLIEVNALLKRAA